MTPARPVVGRQAVSEAYSASGEAWQRGPAAIYDRLAEVVVSRSPVPLAGRFVLDLGAGTGAATRALAAAGASTVAADAAAGMLAAWPGRRPPAAVADALWLPFAGRSFDAVVAAFSFNHLADPAAGLREAARVTRDGGAVVASSYAADDTHPVKEAVDTAAAEAGWTSPPWYEELRRTAIPAMAEPDRVAAACRRAGLCDATVEHHVVDFGPVDPEMLVAWRLGMAQMAPFFAALPPPDRAALTARATQLLGGTAPLRRSILVVVARAAAGAPAPL